MVLFLFLALSGVGVAQDDSINADWPKDMMDNVSMEYATCAAYFAHAASAVKNGGDQETSDRFASIYEEVVTLAVFAAQAHRSDEMAIKVTSARVNMVMDAMQDDIDNDYSNFSLLYQKHHKRCEFIIDNTEAFMQEWAEKAKAMPN